jgi:hypothetical protein
MERLAEPDEAEAIEVAAPPVEAADFGDTLPHSLEEEDDDEGEVEDESDDDDEPDDDDGDDGDDGNGADDDE